ncbi:hypothetical protein [uncultured Methylobacterium sp.]|uniref:hypothetical protein n=1 Tax=uncultured Methylobacterium sp. TaxID=157278 RepID=UPI0035CA484F
MAPRIYPSEPGEGANSVEHRIGQDIDGVDQVSSIVLLCLALAGASVALVLVHFVIG